ncbi:3-methyl-2-oxobutanoate hydroxymethyltransferase [Permianibacter aggregans]|uniref:3-methyl-2-oxobutanoate hydroxymethyltransferase n=1 Tax=Permianibacter aggregans TaxID=1510150 RepID=A0A4R6USZ7_9GAMM|nr:3-methyl-2-oxobutanoate hydroxymethyltransferase [Permianibacter aggregans]QGX40646.1 3-methyl-2-oxobutanoate hydroxymethyltransferase [Permianibacter aggregans]TDQ46514.1 ketopantoate hydroxymethyltransferase [Permianibacter aggregans]
MSQHSTSSQPKITLPRLQEMKKNGDKIVVITAYDASFSRVVNEAGVDVVLVGDSLGNVMLGLDSTVPVTMQDMIHHMRAVARTNQHALLIADMPYMAYATVEQTLQNAAALMQAGAHMVKVEGGTWLCESVKALSDRGIPVCAHLGLTPQSVDALGGYKVQGREPEAATKMRFDAEALQASGARMLVLECVPSELARIISGELTIPVIGIGAGVDTDGQVLVLQDMLGITPGKRPKFSHNFMAEAQGDIQAAVAAYVAAVREKRFPGPEHSFS